MRMGMKMKGGVHGTMRGAVVFDESKLKRLGLVRKMARKMKESSS